MKRRGVYQLELVAAMTLIGGVCLVTVFAALRMERSPGAVDWKSVSGGVEAVRAPKWERVHYVGIAAGGCAAANCHGGQSDGQPGNEWKTSAFDFLQHDPHAQAYNVLFEERSRQMIDRLARGDEALATGKIPFPGKRTDVLWYAEQLEKRCVSCHSTPLPATASNTTAGTLNDYALGVTCEACHGPASRWGDEHLSAHWQTSSKEEVENPIDKNAAGFNQLENLSVAAETCAKCHIGDGSQVDGKSYREVTHDLIAAGHPRLDFDFAAWYASMPAHWNRERAMREEFNIIAWWVGEAAVLEAREKLISARIGTVQGVEDSPRKPWPELAHFDCYACHQALRFPPRNLSAETPFAVSSSGGKPSILQLPVPFGSSWRAYEHVNPEVKLANQRITELLVLRRKTGEVMSGSNTPSVRDLAETLASFAEGGAFVQSFDELLSWYYAADAISRDAVFAAQSSPELQDTAKTMEASLEELKSEMEKYLARDGEVSRYVSPRGFGAAKVIDDETPDPQAVQRAFEKAKQALGELAEEWER